MSATMIYKIEHRKVPSGHNICGNSHREDLGDGLRIVGSQGVSYPLLCHSENGKKPYLVDPYNLVDGFDVANARDLWAPLF
jgi:hypothetical protein